MVTFVCYQCDKTLKKNQIDKHTQCRPLAVICIDCSTTFHGQDYKSHNSCFTEQEKYFGQFANKKNKSQQPIEENTKSQPSKVTTQPAKQQKVEVQMQIQQEQFEWKWKNEIKRVLLQNERKVEYEQLKKQVLQNYVEAGGDLSVEQASQLFDQKVKKLNKIKFVTYVQI